MTTMDWVLRNLKSALLCGWLMVIVLQLSPAACPGADPVPAERSRASLFFHVVREGKAGEVQKLIESGVDVNVRDGDKWTPLQWAAERNQLAVMRLLIKAGADVKAEHYLQGTALHIAAIRCPAEALRDLIKAGADVNSASSVYGPTALHCAAEYNNAANVKVLIDAGATIDSGRMTALTAACRNAQGDNTAAIQMLIEAGANLDPPGNSPLHWVRSPVVAKLLIDAGADVNHRNELGESPLHLAPGRHWGPRAPEFHLLIAAGAEINARDKTRSTPLHRAVMCELPEVVQVLIDAGANVNAKNLNGDTPLGLAQRMKSPELVEQLTAKAAEDGQTEFSRAVVRGDVARVKELIASGTPVDQTGPGKKCALHFASESNQLEMARALIGAKADVNCQDVEGLSPLHLATSKAMGQILLDAGARIDPQPKSPHGSPLSRLATQGRRDVVELLLQRAKTAVPNDVVAMVTYYGQVDVLQVLLERGASPNATLSDIGPSALEIATTGALADTSCPETVTPEIRLKMVKLLTKFEADVNVPSQFDGHTPLHAAAERGETEMVKLLLQYEADPNAAPIGKGFAGLTPLHLAAKNGHSVAAGVLLDAGADVNVSTHETKGKEPRTAVDFALSKVLREMLIKRGGKSFAELGK